MTLKDWKKDEEWFKLGRPTWEKYINGEKYLLQIIIHWFKLTDKYMVVHTAMDLPMSVYERKGFKTKTEALKYAKSYMRSH